MLKAADATVGAVFCVGLGLLDFFAISRRRPDADAHFVDVDCRVGTFGPRRRAESSTNPLVEFVYQSVDHA